MPVAPLLSRKSYNGVMISRTPQAPTDYYAILGLATTAPAIEGALAKVRQRWGYSSIVRLDGGAMPAAAKPARRPKSTQELPPWWPRPIGQDGAAGIAGILRPRLL